MRIEPGILSVLTNVSIPLRAPSSAPVINPSLFSFSIEQDRWTDWAGKTERNQFFYNVLDNLKALTGSPPIIRIGANSQDNTDYDPNIEFAETVFPEPDSTVPYPEADTIVVGDSYYETARFLPSGTHVVWGVNFGANNVTAAYLETKSIINAFSSDAMKEAGVTLDALEIGNEPDLFDDIDKRPSNWTLAEYVPNWTDFARNISAAAGMTETSGPRFWGASFAGSSRDNGFRLEDLYPEGYVDSEPGKLISTMSQHRYSGSFCAGTGGLLQNLMTKSTIRGNLSVFLPDIEATQKAGLEFVMGETNSYSCHGAPGVSNSAGAALWALDYALHATQVGISAIHFHSGIGYKYNLIQPVELTRSILTGEPLDEAIPAHVQPTYYAAVVASEARGKSSNVRAVELDIDNERIAGYAFYDSKGDVARAVLINSEAYLREQESEERSKVHVTLDFAGSEGAKWKSKKMKVKRLAISFADDENGVTWGGQTYETQDGRIQGQSHEETMKVVDGVDVAATEVVLLTFF